jgi:hypothetical protein
VTFRERPSRRRSFPRHRCPPQAKLSQPCPPQAKLSTPLLPAAGERQNAKDSEHHLPSFGDTSRCLASVTLIGGPGQVLLLLPTRSMYSHQCLPERHPCQSLAAGTRYARGASGSIGGKGRAYRRELGRASSVTSMHVPLHPVKARHGFSRFLGRASRCS